MSTELVFEFLTCILLIICACMGANKWYTKYCDLAVTILEALKDGTITEAELDLIKEKYEACKASEDDA